MNTQVHVEVMDDDEEEPKKPDWYVMLQMRIASQHMNIIQLEKRVAELEESLKRATGTKKNKNDECDTTKLPLRSVSRLHGMDHEEWLKEYHNWILEERVEALENKFKQSEEE